MERDGSPPEQRPFISMREHLRRRRERQHENLESFNDSALAALFLSQWAHPSTPVNRIIEAIIGSDELDPDEPTDPWQERLDNILDDPHRKFVVQDNDPLNDYLAMSLESLDDEDFDKRLAVMKAAQVYCISRSELSPHPTHINARTVLYKILSADSRPPSAG